MVWVKILHGITYLLDVLKKTGIISQTHDSKHQFYQQIKHCGIHIVKLQVHGVQLKDLCRTNLLSHFQPGE